MKFLKSQIFLIVCGVVVLLALGAIFWPIGSEKASLQGRAEDRVKLIQQARGLKNSSAEIPGLGKVDGPITENMTRAKQLVQKHIDEQARQILSESGRINQKNRVDEFKLPLLAGEPLRFLLPKIDPNKYDPSLFKDTYDGVFNKWLGQLLYGVDGPGQNLMAGMPPSKVELDAEWQIRSKAAAAENAQFAPTPTPGMIPGMMGGMPGGGNAATDRTNAAYRDFVRQQVSQRAQSIKLYASRDIFQVRPLINMPGAPTEEQIFEAVFDCWLQQDLVKAILAVNSSSESVATSKVKRIYTMAVGSGAAAAGSSGSNAGGAGPMDARAARPVGHAPPQGGLFVTSGGSGGAGGGGDASAGAKAIDYSRSMTGRLSTENYDVTHALLVVDLDPSSINDLINEIYKQSNGYTVLNIRLEASDPFDSISSGYLYGNGPVVKAEILLEALFFREWTVPLMPPSIKGALVPPASASVGGKP